MPLYEYQCDACGHRFEKIVKFSDPPLETCPVCGGHVHKLISSPAFHLKGTGWYITDYAKKDGASGGKSSGAAGESDSKESGSKEKTDSASTSEKSEKSEKSERAEKSDKASRSSDAASSSSAPSAPAPSSPAKKD